MPMNMPNNIVKPKLDITNDSEDMVTIRSSEMVMDEDVDYKCAPSKNFENGSCIPLNLLIAMAEAYNEDNPENKIKLWPTMETLRASKYKKYLLSQFKNRIKHCTNQKCWTKEGFIKKLNEKAKEELKNNTFAPSGPEGKFEWLNTSNIEEVVKQREAVYPDFKFLGAVPMDFEDIEAFGIKDIDFKKLMNQGKNRFGLVINTDNHDQPGQHWISLFFDLRKGQVYFSDSYGIEPPKRVLEFMRKIAKFMRNDLGIKKPDVNYNKLQHQKGDSECGVYSINWILRLLRGDSFEELTTKRLDDDLVNQCREHYFSK